MVLGKQARTSANEVGTATEKVYSGESIQILIETMAKVKQGNIQKTKKQIQDPVAETRE